jgi:hypothetical protein
MKQYRAININLKNHQFFLGTTIKYINNSTINARSFHNHNTKGLASIHDQDLITNKVNI